MTDPRVKAVIDRARARGILAYGDGGFVTQINGVLRTVKDCEVWLDGYDFGFYTEKG